MKLQRCPSASRLLALALGEVQGKRLEEVKQHIHECSTCRQRWENLLKSLPSETGLFQDSLPEVIQKAYRPQRSLPNEVAPLPSPGQIWRVASDAVGPRRLTLLLEVDVTTGLLTVALLSPQIEMASDRDAILSREESPLGYPVMVETWNQFPVLPIQLVRCFGSIRMELVTAIKRLGLLGVAGQGLELGTPLAGEDDPRADFQIEEAEVAGDLSRLAFEKAVSAVEDISSTTSGTVATVAFVDEEDCELRQIFIPWIERIGEIGGATLLLRDYVDLRRKSSARLDFGNSGIWAARMKAESEKWELLTYGRIFHGGEDSGNRLPRIFLKESERPLSSSCTSGKCQITAHTESLQEIVYGSLVEV